MLDCKQYLAVNSRCRNYLVTRKVENCRTQTNSPSSIVAMQRANLCKVDMYYAAGGIIIPTSYARIELLEQGKVD